VLGFRVAGEQRRFGEVVTVETGCARGCRRRPRPAPPSTFRKGGKSHRTDHAASAILEAEQNAVERHAANERLRAVDRIDDPATAGAALERAEFLAEDAVVGKGARQRRAQQLLGARSAIVTGDASALRSTSRSPR